MESVGVSTKKTPEGVKEILTVLPLHCMTPPLHVHPLNENGLPDVPANVCGLTVTSYVPFETDTTAVPKASPAPALAQLTYGLLAPAVGHHDFVGMVIQIRFAPEAGQLPCAAA
jgi:hypothetical protein